MWFQKAFLWNLWDVKLSKTAVKTGVAPHPLKKEHLRFPLCRWWYPDSWLHYPQHFAHDFLQGHFKKVTLQRVYQLYCYGTMKTSSPEILYDTWPSCAAAKSNSVSRDMWHQDAVGSYSLALLWLLFKDSKVCVHVGCVQWWHPPGLWAMVKMSPADIMGVSKTWP